MPVPAFLQPVLWSYDLSKIDTVKNKSLVITQALNYGSPQVINWLFATYPPEEIKKVLYHPSRGTWFWEKLRFWLAKFNLIIDPLEFDLAIRDLNPKVKIYQEFFRRKGF